MQATNRDVFSIREKKPMIFIYVRSDLKSDRTEYLHLQCERQEVRASSCRNPTEQIFFKTTFFRHFVTFAFNFLSFRILRQVMNFFETSLTSLLQNNLFWFPKSIFWQTKTYHLANQNKLFCFFKAQSSCEITYISNDIIYSV